MRRVLLRWAPFAVVATLVALFVLLVVPVDREFVLRIYALVVGGLALATLAAATGFATRRTPSAFAAALRRKPVRSDGRRSSRGSSARSHSRSRTPRTSTTGSVRRSSPPPTLRSGAVTASRWSGRRS